MSVITKAIFNVLNGDATLTALLGTFDGSAAIFTTDPPPSGAILPYIVTAGDVSNVPVSSNSHKALIVNSSLYEFPFASIAVI